MNAADAQIRKLRGGYYTSRAVAQWLCDWAVKTPKDRVLEPSCGDGVFLEAAAARLLKLGAQKRAALEQLTGIEIVPAEVGQATARLHSVLGNGIPAPVHADDFFAWLGQHPGPMYDCAVGNPPFIRYQNFPEPCRSRAMGMMVGSGFKPNKLTNIWVPFVVGAAERLAPGGRLALVLPAELLQVTYAGQLRSFLVDRFESIDIYACNELFFPGAEQEVVLFLAAGKRAQPSASSRCRIDLHQTATVDEVLSTKPKPERRSRSQKTVRHDSEKWLKYFLSAREISFMRRLRADDSITTLDAHASVDVGVVTGRNEFFVLSQADVEEHGLQRYTKRLVGRSAQLRGATLSPSEWESLAEEGHRVFLFEVDQATNGSLTASAKRYIKDGERKGFHSGYKCRIRDPWYCVPSVWDPDCFLFRQIYDFPRFVMNKAAATSTDTIHRMNCKKNPSVVARNLFTHLTAASAEIEGRSYGGGVLELEPTEAERLLAPAALQKALPMRAIDRMIRAGRLEEVLEENDKIVLVDGLGLSTRECSMLRGIWKKMRDRRLSRRQRKARAEA